MKFSGRIIKFAASIFIVAAIMLMTGCKGRTAENVEPTGDTIEVTVSSNSEQPN